jgi:trans-aconitate methyltransferase
MTEPASDHVRTIYERFAREWDADRSAARGNDRKWHVRFVGLLLPGAHIIDLGCGSGASVARHLVAHGLRVTGVDSAPSMIALCRARLPDQDSVVGDMRQISFAWQADGILAWDSYFFLEPDDQRRMFERFAAHAAAGCVLMFNSGPRFGAAIGEYRGEPLYHASLDAADYRTLLDRAGFELLDHVVEGPQAGGRTVWLARRRAG